MNDWFNITDVSDNIIITFNHTTTDRDFDYYLDYYRNIYNSNKNVRVVFDFRNFI